MIWSESALRDLDEVAAFVSVQDGREAASIVREAMRAAEERADFAESGAIVPEWNDPQLREVLVKQAFRLIYAVRSDAVAVVAFVCRSRKLRRKSSARRGRT